MRTKDQIPFVPASEATRCAYACLDVVQSERPPAFVAGVALLFTQMCASLGLDPSQMIDASNRRINHDDTFHKRELKAMNDFFKGELA